MQSNWNKKNEDILSEGLPLQPFGVNNWGLTKENCLKAINKLRELSIPILGGDVMKLENKQWVYTYDNWYCDKLPNESNENFASRSNQLASDYVKNYSSQKDIKILFVLVPED